MGELPKCTSLISFLMHSANWYGREAPFAARGANEEASVWGAIQTLTMPQRIASRVSSAVFLAPSFFRIWVR